MKIMSKNIADYIDLNYDIEEFNDIKELYKIEELVINSLDYSLEVAPFYAAELSYFKNLKDCTFINFEITDEIIDNLNKTSLNELSLDNCRCIVNKNINLKRLQIEMSNVNLKNIKTQELIIVECGTIDINDIINNELKELKIFNCDILNSELLSNLEDCKIEIMGCTLDNESVKKLEKINYNPNKYEKII